MEGNFSNRVQDVIRLSREEALRLGHDYIGTEHLLLGLIREGEGIAAKILKNLKIDLFKLKQKIEESTRPKVPATQMGNVPLTKQAEKVLKITYLEAKICKSNIIGTEHLLLSILKGEDNIAAQILEQFSVTYDLARDELQEITGSSGPGEPEDSPMEESFSSGGSERPARKGESRKGERTKTPVLDNFGRDITRLAIEDRLDPIIGREKEIERVPRFSVAAKRTTRCSLANPEWAKPL